MIILPRLGFVKLKTMSSLPPATRCIHRPLCLRNSLRVLMQRRSLQGCITYPKPMPMWPHSFQKRSVRLVADSVKGHTREFSGIDPFDTPKTTYPAGLCTKMILHNASPQP